MPTIADLLSVPGEIEFEGKVYRLRPPNQEEQARFSRWLERRAREGVGRAVELPPDEQEKDRRVINTEIGAGLFEWGSDGYVAALRRPFGITKMLSLVLQTEGHAEADEAFCRRLVEKAMLEVAAVVAVAEADDPKAAAAALRSLGLPADFFRRGKGRRSSGSGTRRSTKRRKKSSR